jgi:bifunctional enzyme CysN/CysC
MVGWSEAAFERIKAEYLAFAANLGPARIACIPVCALQGDNVTRVSRLMPWYCGPTLIEHLESVEIGSGIAEKPFRMPVQWVNRPNATFRGYAGTIVAGTVRPGDRLAVLPKGRAVEVARLRTLTPTNESLDAVVSRGAAAENQFHVRGSGGFVWPGGSTGRVAVPFCNLPQAAG